MSTRGRQSGSFGDEMTNILIAVLIGTFGLTLVLRAAGSVAALLTGVSQPGVGISGGVGVLFDPANPGRALGSGEMIPFLYWLVASVMLAILVVLLMWAWTRWRRHSRNVDTDPRRLPGTATAYEVQATASSRALLRRATTLRPSLERPEPSDVGYRLGQSRGKVVWASVEDSILLIGPPRSGKGLHIVIPAILDAPGAVVTTSTRPDNLTSTLRARMRVGPVMIFDPQHLAEGVPAGLRWSPIRGCEDPLTAMIRAAGLAAATGLADGGVDGGGFWEGKTRVALQAMLHAAALDNRTPAELFRWTLDPSAAADAVAILNASPRAATGWSEGLEAMIETDPRTRDSIWQGVSLALASLADPRVLAAVSPGPDEAFDPEAFIREKGTLYLLATGAGAGNSAALVARSLRTSLRPPVEWQHDRPGRDLIRRCCSRSMRSEILRLCHRFPRSWRRVAVLESRRCLCCSHLLRPETNGARIKPQQYGIRASRRLFSVGHRTRATCRISRP